jgi:hypothetical protein
VNGTDRLSPAGRKGTIWYETTLYDPRPEGYGGGMSGFLTKSKERAFKEAEKILRGKSRSFGRLRDFEQVWVFEYELVGVKEGDFDSDENATWIVSLDAQGRIVVTPREREGGGA